jgi:predicted short-subunit dehydrogenase-like oxidoreductase (DUF2520 family)
MGFAAGAATFRRYRVTRGKCAQLDDAFVKALIDHAFGRHGTVDSGEEYGWVTPEHLFDVRFAAEKIEAGRFAHFFFRVDKLAPPASIARSYVAMEQAAALEVSGRAFLTKQEKRQAKEAAVARAETEARSGAFRRISAWPVLLDLDRQMLYFATTSQQANEKLQKLFEETFDAALEPVNAHTLAVRAVEPSGQRRSLEDARPAHMIEPPTDVDGDVYSLDPADRSFLGREFLTWLWFTVDRAEGLIQLLGKQDAACSIVRAMQLRCDFNLTGSVAVRGDGPAAMAEARQALRTGKQPIKMGMLLAAPAGEWSFTLDGAKLDVSGAALPASEEKDPVTKLEARGESIADLAEAIDDLYSAFLKLRLSGEWAARLRDMRQWAADRPEATTRQPRLATA